MSRLRKSMASFLSFTIWANIFLLIYEIFFKKFGARGGNKNKNKMQNSTPIFFFRFKANTVFKHVKF